MNKAVRASVVLSLGALLFLLTACERQNGTAATAEAEQHPAEGTIVAVGDSLTAGLGVNEEHAYPGLLQKKLNAAGYRWRVVNAGISGETSSGTLSRVNWVLRLKPDIVVLETGANDGLRGIDPRLTRDNIDRTIGVLKENGVTVVLAGMRMSENLGVEFTRKFAEIYPAVAAKHDLVLVPFFLQDVAGDPRLNQSDGIHPNEEGYRLIAENIYPYVVRAIDRRKAGPWRKGRP